MTAIDRTAYQRFKRTYSARELSKIYTPPPDEVHFATTTARSDSLRFNLLLLLKCFQRLGYFPALGAIPEVLIAHIRTSMGLSPDQAPLGYDTPRTLYRPTSSSEPICALRPLAKQRGIRRRSLSAKRRAGWIGLPI